jgi:tetratricopeptide (TPR) repeat protein
VFCRTGAALAAVVFSFLLLGGCNRSTQRGVERLAIAPFENLSDDAAFNWMGPAISEAVAAQIEGSSTMQPVALASPEATGVLRGYFTVAGGRITLKAQRENLRSRRIVRTFTIQGDILRVADTLARDLDSGARPYETKIPEALKALIEGSAAGDAAALERAIALDPGFGTPYLALARLRLVRGERAAFQEVLAKARAQGGRITETRRAELDLLAADADGDGPAQQRALLALGRLKPADAGIPRRLAMAHTAAHHYDEAVAWYRKATSLDPSSGPTWNQFGYAEAYRKNLQGARSALLEYARMAPRDANPLDSLGEVHYYLGAFADAEQYFLQAYDKAPSFLGGAELYKAARARLMTGDVNGADQVFRRYADARKAARDPLLPYREAQWLTLTGRGRDPVKAQGGAAEGKLAAVYQMLEAKQFAEAVPLLQSLIAEADPLAPEQFNVLLAWALVETGRIQEAAPLLETYGAPQAGLEGPFIRFTFPRVFLLKAQVLDQQGKGREAGAMREIYKKLSGTTGGR